MPITIHTRQSKANQAAEAWARQYPAGSEASMLVTGTVLKVLGRHPNPDQVDAIIGNSSWTDPGTCSNCGATPPAVAEVGEAPDCESATAKMCLACLKKAVEMLEAATPAQDDGQTVCAGPGPCGGDNCTAAHYPRLGALQDQVHKDPPGSRIGRSVRVS